MKKILFFICLMMVGIIYAQDKQIGSWRNDLDYLVKRIEIMHPNPYSFISKEKFYKIKEKLYNEIPNLSEAEIVISISELLAALEDGHTGWAMEQSDPQWLEQTFHLLPIIQYSFKDGIYLIAGLSQYSEFVGLKVIKIGSMPISEVVNKLGKMWSVDNSYGEKKFLYYSLSIAEMLKKTGAIEDVNEIEVVLQNANAEEVKANLATVSLMSMVMYFASTWYPQSGNGLVAMNEKTENDLPLWLKNTDKSFWFEYIPKEKIMYLQINSLNFPHGDANSEDPFGKLCEQFFEAFDKSSAEKLVIDLRKNTGGNHVELPLLKGILARPRIDSPDKLFLITGRVTFSAAVHLTTILKKHTNVTLIGEPASGRPNHYGAKRGFRLLNHPQIEIVSSIDYYQDSEPFDFNIVNNPDVWAELMAADYMNNIDPAIETIENYDQIVSMVRSFELKMEKAYSEKGIVGMKETYSSIKKALLESGCNREKFFTEFYSRYFSEQKKSNADLLEYLSFAINECPESIDLSYFLASQLESEGRFEEAEIMYKRSLQLNPAHHYAKMKLDLMKLKAKK